MNNQIWHLIAKYGATHAGENKHFASENKVLKSIN